MKIIRSSAEMKNLSLTLQKSGRTIGLVPTMGALHRGHLSLVEIAKKNADIVVMSIFVNPTQFGPGEDFEKYPRLFESDCAKAENAGCDYVFAPAVEDMYPQHYSTYVSVEGITSALCGISRPNHFRGVATVVLKLFNIVNPQIAVFGQKDAQQVLVIKRMIHDLSCSVRVEVAPIIREDDGLAMSSRNVYLTANERRDVPNIYKSLSSIKEMFDNGERNVSVLKESLVRGLSCSPLIKPEYTEFVDTVDIRPLNTINTVTLVAVACRTTESNTRLIDNIVLGGSL